MSDGDEPEDGGSDDAPAEDAGGHGGPDEAPDPLGADDPAAAIEANLDAVADSLPGAETEAELDAVEADLDAVAAALEEADLPEPDEDAEDPAEALEDRISELRGDLEAERGPYAEDVTEALADAAGTLRDAEWTEDGEGEAVDAVATFLDAAEDHVTVPEAGATPADAAEDLETVAEAVEAAGLDPDEDAETVAALLEATDALETDLEAAEVWEDLSVREQLAAEGYYDDLDSEARKDFPPEWSAMKQFSKAGEVEPILLALEKLGDSDFTEEYVYDQLVRLGRDAAPAFDEMHSRAQKRDKRPIEILGKIADDEACETLHEFIDGDGDPKLQRVTLKALGRIGSEESTQPVANRLAAEEGGVRSVAARALGMIGDTRAIEPLADTLAEDEADEVRASAAWALRQIGTERAREAAAEFADDRSYLVQAEAEKAL